MSTIQKAFVFIVVILALVTATVQLVLFAQRVDWSERHQEAQRQVTTLTAELNSATAELAQVRSDKTTAVTDLEAQLASTQNDLDAARRRLESALTDKANLEALVSTANAKLEVVAQNMEALAVRNEELNVAKQAAEEELVRVSAARQDAEEQLTLVSRQARDLQEQVSSLEETVAERADRIRTLQQEVEVLRQYYPVDPVALEVVPEVTVFGRIKQVSDDRETIYLSIGSDDGVENGMTLMIYKADGTYVADARIFNVSPDQSAARVLRPVYATVMEGDYVANK